MKQSPWQEGFDAGFSGEPELMPYFCEPEAIDWTEGYKAGVSARADAEQEAADLADEWETQQDAVGRG